MRARAGRRSGRKRFRAWTGGALLAGVLVSIATASQAQVCGGTVEVIEWPFLDAVWILGDAQDNCIDITRQGADLVVQGGGGTAVNGSPVDATGRKTIHVLLGRGNDDVEMTQVIWPETRWYVSTDAGSDLIRVDVARLQKLDVAAGRDDDDVGVVDVQVLERSVVDGGPGVSDLLGNVTGVDGGVDLIGFEVIDPI